MSLQYLVLSLAQQISSSLPLQEPVQVLYERPQEEFETVPVLLYLPQHAPYFARPVLRFRRIADEIPEDVLDADACLSSTNK